MNSVANDARRWLNEILAQSPGRPVAPEAVWRVLDRRIGHGPLAVGRAKNLLAFIGQELNAGRAGPGLRSAQDAAAAYLSHEQDRLKVAA